VALASQLAADLPPVWGEVNQLAQVITNLLTNALNYTPTGQVVITTWQANGAVCLSVQDTGIGIDDEDLPHLFERFYRGRRTAGSDLPGTGLGLAIVKEIVALHSGRIQVSSQVGNGSTFLLSLPAVAGIEETQNGIAVPVHQSKTTAAELATDPPAYPSTSAPPQST
jgi:signal transduction histidine kinase